ncbi:MAG TPA: magnesium chelatase [Blastocatellia bacterium]|nr:magnesium chelatase [Blastocatellia bacterium]HMY72764.1 magnesium chelatase [Blastocatellia bacterium]HMZ18353.1 magnesium chelatase [Blastocatellia bacterium]HNG31720.1 magnesium chelatase [Blastocatellia bacterium]
MLKPQTLGELKASGYRSRSVKTEIRQNLIKRLRLNEPLFPGVIGYEDTVIPQIVNALLAQQNIILLGLRGQAKSRILRELTGLLDPELPVLAGSEINDDPLAPLSAYGRQLIAEKGDAAPIAWVERDARYVEKLATPDVSIADIIGDVDPIKAARGGHLLSDELTIHYGLLPRANRGIFAINELPDLAGKIQVGLFNILQEGDVQIKGYPIRLPLDVLLVFSANPEDYTARGKIITPLKDRIGAEIQTHYPASLELGISITKQEAWTERYENEFADDALTVRIPEAIYEVVEQIAFLARQDKRIDSRSGVSQRLPISVLESVISNAERRALQNGETATSPRISDVYAALPAITGKLELEYEGEQVGAERIAKDLIRKACGEVFTERFSGIDFRQVMDHFNHGKTLTLSDAMTAEEALNQLRKVKGLLAAAQCGKLEDEQPGSLIVACELILEGLHSQKKLARNEERGKASYGQAPPERPNRRQTFDDWSGGRVN